jgi:uncharacterized membrane protein YdjX (TVP38/TMEM64 family)
MPEAVTQLASPPTPVWRNALTKAGVLLVLAAVCLAVVYATPLRTHLNQVEEMRAWIHSFGPWGPLTLTALIAGLVAIGMPRLILCGVAGFVFGFWTGLTTVTLGTLAGYYLTFIVTRWGGRDLTLDHWAVCRRFCRLFERGGIESVLLLRLLPINGFVVNLGLAVTTVRHRDFFMGTLIGSLPEAVPMVLVGAGLLHPSAGKTAGMLLLAIALVVVAGIGVRLYTRLFREEVAAEACPTAAPPITKT